MKRVYKDYQSKKIVHAALMTHSDFEEMCSSFEINHGVYPDGEGDGYHVIYQKGTDKEFHGWCPKDVFESGNDHHNEKSKDVGCVEPLNKLPGYKTLTNQEFDQINEIKRVAELVGNLVDQTKIVDECDMRWASIAKTHLQQGFMALTRSVSRNDNF